MGLNKKALKLAAYKRCGKDRKVTLGRRTVLGHDPSMSDSSSLVAAEVETVYAGNGKWKYGKYLGRIGQPDNRIISANLLTGIIPKSADPIVKEIDADTNELTIEFTAIKSGFDPINQMLAGGLHPGSFTTVSPQRSVLHETHMKLIAAQMERVAQKEWGNLTGDKDVGSV